MPEYVRDKEITYHGYRERLYKKAAKRGISYPEVKKMLKLTFNVDTASDLTLDEHKKVMLMLDAFPLVPEDQRPVRL